MWVGFRYGSLRPLSKSCFIGPQITDFSQRKSDRSSYEVDELPVTEQELQKLKNPDTEQELEVSFNYCKAISFFLLFFFFFLSFCLFAFLPFLGPLPAAYGGSLGVEWEL